METSASGQSRLDPGCQLSGWTVSRFIFQIATSEASQLKIPPAPQWREICVKVVQGCVLRHLGGSAGVTVESGADADLSPLIPSLAVQPWKPSLMKTVFLWLRRSGKSKHSGQMLVFIGWIVRLNMTFFCRVAKPQQIQWHGNFENRTRVQRFTVYAQLRNGIIFPFRTLCSKLFDIKMSSMPSRRYDYEHWSLRMSPLSWLVN